MKMYSVTTNTKAILLENPSDSSSKRMYDCVWDTRDYHTTKDLIFSDDQLVTDCIRIHNGNSNFNENSTPYKLAERGYLIFTHNAANQQKYLLAVPFTSVTTS